MAVGQWAKPYLNGGNGAAGGGGGGGGGAGIVCEGDVNAQNQSITLRMTAGELLDAFLQGNNIVIHANMENPSGVAHICYVLLSATYAGGDYKFSIAIDESITTFSANDADQYPVIYQE